MIRLLTTPDDLARYNAWVLAHPQGSLWQSAEWKTYQEAVGRDVRIYAHEVDGNIIASALVVIDRTAWNLSTWEIPRGPLYEEKGERKEEKGNEEKGKRDESAQALLEHIEQEARTNRCITLYLSPLQSCSTGRFPLVTSSRHIQPTATRIIDLTKTHEEILAQMKPKGRYNIGVAEKHGVRTEESDDVGAFYTLMATTAARDRFRPLRHDVYEAFLRKLPGTFLLLAYQSGSAEPIAGFMGVVWPTDRLPLAATPSTGIYYYGASSYEHRSLMAPYALQWAAMQRCKAAGCTRYDLLGVAPPDAGAEHPWQGVSAFKEKFGGTVVTYPAEQRRTLKPLIRSLLAMKRRFG